MIFQGYAYILDAAFKQEESNDRIFKENWVAVTDWNEESRYQSRGQREAEAIVAAIRDPEHGVLQWLKQNWYTKPYTTARPFFVNWTGRIFQSMLCFGSTFRRDIGD